MTHADLFTHSLTMTHAELLTHSLTMTHAELFINTQSQAEEEIAKTLKFWQILENFLEFWRFSDSKSNLFFSLTNAHAELLTHSLTQSHTVSR